MHTITITQPDRAPIRTDAIKLSIPGLHHDRYDAFIDQCIEEATAATESYIDKHLIKRTVQTTLYYRDIISTRAESKYRSNPFRYSWYLDTPPFVPIELDRTPFLNIDGTDSAGIELGIKYKENNTSTPVEWPRSNYRIENQAGGFPLIVPTEDSDTPNNLSIDSEFIVTYETGYGANGADVPSDINSAIRQYARAIYIQRQSDSGAVPVLNQTLLSPYISWNGF